MPRGCSAGGEPPASSEGMFGSGMGGRSLRLGGGDDGEGVGGCAVDGARRSEAAGGLLARWAQTLSVALHRATARNLRAAPGDEATRQERDGRLADRSWQAKGLSVCCAVWFSRCFWRLVLACAR